MHIALAFAFLLAQASHSGGPPRGEAQEHKPAPVPDGDKPRASEHGVTSGRQEAAHGARAAHERGEEHEEGGVADDSFHPVADEVWGPPGFWIGAHHVDLSITKHVINMWIAAGTPPPGLPPPAARPRGKVPPALPLVVTGLGVGRPAWGAAAQNPGGAHPPAGGGGEKAPG